MPGQLEISDSRLIPASQSRISNLQAPNGFGINYGLPDRPARGWKTAAPSASLGPKSAGDPIALSAAAEGRSALRSAHSILPHRHSNRAAAAKTHYPSS